MKFNRIHHIAVIAVDIWRSKRFYTEILGFNEKSARFRKKRKSWEIHLQINQDIQLELFSFPKTPERLTYPEASGLRHIAFEVEKIEEAISYLVNKGVIVEKKIRTDRLTKKRFTFFFDPDGLPIEIYEL